MTLAEVGEIFAYWADNPPTHLMMQAVARALGWAPPGCTLPAPALDDIVASLPPGLGFAADASGLPAPVLDVEAMRRRNRARLAERGRNRAPPADRDRA